MTIVRIGSNPKFAAGWDKAFTKKGALGKKGASGKKSAGKPAAKKLARKPARSRK